ncbi:MAG: type II toxin-antitoxin system VapC family toxin [Thiolinea sp.]
MLVDTDIIIWSLRGAESATDFIDSLEEMYISDVTYMELVQGTVSKSEFRALQKTLDYIEVVRLPVTAEISAKAVELVELFTHSHAMQLGDALIAATALVHDLPLSSGNRKHFEPIPGLQLHVFRKEA